MIKAWLALSGAAGLAACSQTTLNAPTSPPGASDFATIATSATPLSARVRIEDGTFLTGQDAIYNEEGPTRQTTVGSFWIDPHEVTNAQFAEFVKATGYVSLAEKPDAAVANSWQGAISDWVRRMSVSGWRMTRTSRTEVGI